MADTRDRNSREAMHQIMAQVNVEIVKRSDETKGFTVLPKRWVVERTFAWLCHCRRFAKLNRTGRAFLLLASIRLMLRRLGRTGT
jgi:transposase